MTAFIGIDNGLSGAIAGLNADGSIAGTWLMPAAKVGKGSELFPSLLASILKQHYGGTVVLERPTKHAAGILSLCSTWCCYGGIRAVLELQQFRVHEVATPRQWQKTFWAVPKMPKGQKFDTKAAALRVARQLWPEQSFLATALCTTPHNGIVDALLIAEHGRRTLGGTTQ